MIYNIPGRVVEEITEFAKTNGIRKVILFGSRARGTNKPRSDIDLAVIDGDALNFYYDLEEKAHTLLMFDVVAINKGITEELQREIERDGIVIYEEV